jgi:hypothetical protein
MLKNSLCPYCSRTMIKAENQPNSRSVEHLIPNTVLRKKRKNNEGDFYACRECNSRKSHIDYVLGVIAKIQSTDDDFASQALIRAVAGGERISDRFVRMVSRADETPQGIKMEIPISGKELVEYIRFLGKGQYFKRRGRIFDEKNQVMIVDFANKEIHSILEDSYIDKHGSHPVRDLEMNPYSEVISSGECVIWSKNENYLFFFHDYISISIRVRPRNRKNTERENRANKYLIDSFRQ